MDIRVRKQVGFLVRDYFPRMRSFFAGFDWWLFLIALPIMAAGLITMNALSGSAVGDNYFFDRQVLWVCISVFVFFSFSAVRYSFLRRTSVVVIVFCFAVFLLTLLFGLGAVTKGAQSWFHFGSIAFQPSDLAKVALIIVLAKYFNRRHVEIRHMRHIIVSGIYAFILFVLTLLQPDFGSAVVIFLLWFGMLLVSGISRKHVLLLVFSCAVVVTGLWHFGFADYQKDRIRNFVNPLANISGSGYNAYQSMIAVGSGQLWGKGVGYGTQSRLQFLPEHRTDFIFAAFAEEWGFIGSVLLLLFYVALIARIAFVSMRGAGNFETLFGFGVALYFTIQLVINVGMNIGLLPVTGLVAPLMSYGGSHMLVEGMMLGMVAGMRRYSLVTHKNEMRNEFLGLE